MRACDRHRRCGRLYCIAGKRQPCRPRPPSLRLRRRSARQQHNQQLRQQSPAARSIPRGAPFGALLGFECSGQRRPRPVCRVNLHVIDEPFPNQAARPVAGLNRVSARRSKMAAVRADRQRGSIAPPACARCAFAHTSRRRRWVVRALVLTLGLPQPGPVEQGSCGRAVFCFTAQKMDIREPYW